MKISICIPCYNSSAFLRRCLDSALAVEHPDKEIILIDDASTDETRKIAKDYAGSIFYSENEKNLGQPANTNRCLARATGDYVVILHSDDYLLPNFAKTLVPLLDSNPKVAFAVGERKTADAHGIEEDVTPFYSRNCIVPGIEQARILMQTSFLPCQVLVRRAVLTNIGGVDERHVVNLDGLLWFKCALQGDVAYTRTPVGVYRIHDASTTASYNQTSDHVLEYYETLKAMMKHARGRPVLEQNIPVARKRVAEIALRYCRQAFATKKYQVVREYIELARFFDPDIRKRHAYRVIEFCIDSEDVDPQLLLARLADTLPSKRTESYPPPPGSKVER
jgi:glycosyltransferase involved in cell wall biosynthesis